MWLEKNITMILYSQKKDRSFSIKLSFNILEKKKEFKMVNPILVGPENKYQYF